MSEILKEITKELPHVGHHLLQTEAGKELTAALVEAAPPLIPAITAAVVLSEADFFNGPKAHELSNIIKQHALAGTAVGFIPVPGADVAAMVANTWTMYVRINKAVGVSFEKNALKSIASGVFANLASVIPGAMVTVAAGSIFKLFPGIGTLGGVAVSALANVAIMYVAGKVYLKSLEILIRNGDAVTAENIKKYTTDISKDKDFVTSAYAEGKAVAKASKSK